MFRIADSHSQGKCHYGHHILTYLDKKNFPSSLVGKEKFKTTNKLCVKHYLYWWPHKVTISWKKKGKFKIFVIYNSLLSTWKHDKLYGCFYFCFQSYKSIKHLLNGVRTWMRAGDELFSLVQTFLLMVNFLSRTLFYFPVMRPKLETTLTHQICL